MKTKLLSFIITMLLAGNIIGQTPQAIKYQTVIRDNSGDVVSNQNISIRLSILQGSETGPAVYIETHNDTTNQFGLVNLKAGYGNIVSGDFSTIDWGNDSYFIQTEIDASGGSNYLLAGVSEILSVPYALYAKTAGNIDGMVDVKSIPINVYGTYLLGGASYEMGMGGNSGIKLPVDGTPSVTINFTIPSDYAPGDTIFIRMVNSSNNTGNVVLWPNFTSVAQPGSGYNQGGYSDSGFTLGDVNIASTAIPVVSTGYFVSPDTNKELHPGDAVSLGFFRRGGTGDDINKGYLMIHSIDLRY